MDPALRRLLEVGEADDEVAVMVRMRGPSPSLPPGARVVSRFGDVATMRLPRAAVEDLRESAEVLSVKRPWSYRPELVRIDAESVDASAQDVRRPEGLVPTGRGVVVGVADWGLDFRHPAFRRPDGSTRVLALWDQAAQPDPGRPNRFGYGRIHTREDIDRALRQDDPLTALGYDPTVWDVGAGTHGTATASIAAGSAWPGGVEGMAPGADIVFVNLAGGGPLGHSHMLAEAVDLVRETAAGRPWVMNMSLGRHGGPHDGSTLLEQMLDAAVAETAGLIVNSAGNYFSSNVHTSGRLRRGEIAARTLRLSGGRRDLHEIDLWYAGGDRLHVGLRAPGGERLLVRPGRDATLTVAGEPVARIQHRTNDPNNGRNQVVLRIRGDAPAGRWKLLVAAAEVTDGRFDAWIEREALRPGTQARFDPADAVATTTTGTIANGVRNIAVGAYDHHHPDRPPTRFSSSGDTVDGRSKPNLLAPGERVLVARSLPRAASEGAPLTARMSGTSMAAPYVAGTLACMMEIGGTLPAERLRSVVIDTAEPYRGDEPVRAGSGYADPLAAVRALEPVHARTGETTDETGGIGMPPIQPAAVATDPDAALERLGTSAWALFEAFALGRQASERERLAGTVELLTAPGDHAADAPRPGDLLVRGVLGGGYATASSLVTGELLDRSEAQREGLKPESTLPGRYAWVVESGILGHAQEERFARRVTDRRGFLPRDQVLLRLAAEAAPAPAPPSAPAPAAGSQPEQDFESAPEWTAEAEPERTAEDGAEWTAETEPEWDVESDSEWQPEAVNRRSPAYIRWYQDALNRIDGAGLAVDGVLGPLTRAAVRRYQARKGLAVDGVVGPITERALMLDGAVPPPGYDGPPVQTAGEFALLVDADRDGAVDASRPASTWAFGPGGSGAVVLVNNDDDGIDGSPDNAGPGIDGGNDIGDLAPLRIAPPAGATVPAGTVLELSVDPSECLRIFSSRSAGATEIVGPTVGATHRFATLPTAPLDLAMEGVHYAGTSALPNRTFSGEVEIRLVTIDPSGRRAEQTARVRVAPWIVPNHLDHAETVFVADQGTANDVFRTELRAALAPTGVSVVEHPVVSDVWMQDCMEFGYATLPGQALRTVLKVPRKATRELQAYPRTLLRDDLGFAEEGDTVWFATTYDAGGNVEASPPVTVGGKRYPFGRIYYGRGPGPGLNRIDWEFEDFLRAQVVQAPFPINTDWLAVGHVDEVVSFVPARDRLGFRMLIGSPRLAYRLLDGFARGNPSATMLSGRELFDRRTDPPTRVPVQQSVQDFLRLPADFHPQLRAHPRRPRQSLREYNRARQADLDGIRRTMMRELGLSSRDIIEVPVVYMPDPGYPDFADALVPAMVNMLVVNDTCVVPKPFGPAPDPMEADVRANLSGLGLNVTFIDCWGYHMNSGEVHCATNTLRRATPQAWWEFQP